MKHLFIASILALLSITAFAEDQIIFHSGTEANGEVVRVEEFLIVFKYTGENAEQTISKLIVNKIIFGSGRVQEITDKIVIRGKEDWEKVELVFDKTMVVGLKKVGEVKGKTSGFFSGSVSAAGADKRSMKKLLMAAAEMNAPFVYLTADKDAARGVGSSYGSQGLKKGIAYTY